MSETVADLIIGGLASSGVKRIFGLPGDSLNPLMDALRRDRRIEFIQVRHEEGAALAASFQSKYTGELSVCMGTSGPGSIHLLNGLYDAKMESMPVLALTGQIETDLLGTDYFQEVDMMHLYSDVSVYQQRITNPESAHAILRRAIFEARTHPGVAHLDLPVDVLRMAARIPANLGMTEPPERDERPSLSAVQEMIDGSQKPVIMYGRGCTGLSRQLSDLSERIGAPLIYALNGKGIIPDSDPRVMGGLGLLGTKASVDALKNADLVILIGTSFPYVQFMPEHVRFIQVDRNPLNIGKRVSPDAYCVCSAEYFLKSIAVKEKRDKYYLQLSDSKKKWVAQMQDDEKAGPGKLRPEAVAASLAVNLPPGTIVLGDTGNVTVWVARNMRMETEHRFLFSSWLGTMGAGIPGSVGVSFASGMPVLAVVGDGSFAMTMMELITAKKYDRPVKIAVFNNSKLGMIKFEEEVMGYPEFGVDLLNPDFQKIAQSMGIQGFSVENAKDLDATVKSFLNCDGPAVLNAFVDPDEKPMPPKLTFEQAKGYVTSILREKLGSI